MGEPRGSKLVSHAAKKTREAMVVKLKRLIAREYPDMAPNTAFERIRDATGISLSSMQRITSGRTGPSIDTLSDLARHLGSTVADILTQDAEADEETPFGEPEPDAKRPPKARPSPRAPY